MKLEAYPINECNCARCVEMCIEYPCFGTPNDIMNLIKAGYGEKLMIGFISEDVSEETEIIIPARKGFEQTRGGGYYRENPCVFLRNNLCELHEYNLKPLLGKIASCEKSVMDAAELILKKWNFSQGLKIKEIWKKQFCKTNL